MEESVLVQELNKLDLPEIKKITSIWNINQLSVQDKESSIDELTSALLNEFYLKGVLEKLTPLQVTILTLILKNKGVQTLGEIVRKVSLPPLNVEMELGVLRKYYLVYQRKNRERLTNNLDKYHAFEEISNLIKLDTNAKGDKFKFSIQKFITNKSMSDISETWKSIFPSESIANIDAFYQKTTSEEGFNACLESLTDLERDVIHQIFIHGGIMEVASARNFIHINRGKFEEIIPSLEKKYLLFDTYYVDEKFIRILTLPIELLAYFQNNPILPSLKKGTRQKQEKIAKNDLDFFLNIKKLVLYVSRKGLSLAKSGKIKQADNKRTEQELLKLDIDIFPEKGQVYQIELILPILRLLYLVDIKGENIKLTGDIDEFQKKDIFELMNTVIHEVNEVRSKRYYSPEVFSAIEVPFYDKLILDKCVEIILQNKIVNLSVILSNVIREHLVLSPSFKIKTFEVDLVDIKKEIISAIFYLHLFGLISVEYPNRNIFLSDLGKYYFQSKSLQRATEKGGITINPDFTIIVFPEKCSIHGIHLLKAFTELKDFDRVYTFVLTKEAFQQGILLGYDQGVFIQFLKESNKADLSQNLLFLFEDWSGNLPIVVITEDCVLLQTSEPQTMELLIGQLKGKKIIVQEEISPTAILIDKSKIQEVIAISEKLNLIIKLIR
ncbi:MAG: helicase [Leptospiraceae bacterium]|nr:helicase [Leptospiraceae bacterium]MCP5493138.1 helicase [Leptospiraceae bacterium]